MKGAFMLCWLAASAKTQHKPTIGNTTLMSAPCLAFFFKPGGNDLGEGISQLDKGMARRGRRCRLRGSHRATAGLGISEKGAAHTDLAKFWAQTEQMAKYGCV